MVSATTETKTDVAAREREPNGSLTREAVLEALDDVKDPEIPVVSVVELGIVQQVRIDRRAVHVDITPTFSGCPALHVMKAEIAERIEELGAEEVTVRVVLDPPWTSDRIAPEARERMKSIGLTPPPPVASSDRFTADITLQPASTKAAIESDNEPETPTECPFCGSHETVVENPFGPTICRTLHYCNDCEQPFESFKAL